MTRKRWIADEVSGNHAALTGEHADHLVRVLRARVGQEFDLAAADVVRRGRITAITDHRVEFELGDVVPANLVANVTLLLAVFKFDRMEWAIEKCTELGVARVIPVFSRRTDSHLAAAAVKRVERWQRLARQASEQSRRSAPPEVSAPIKVEAAMTFPGALRIVLAESEEQTLLRDVLKSRAADGGVFLAVGPEGGWTEDEVRSFQQAGWVSASLGNNILRAETAAIAGVAIVASALRSI